MITLKVFIFTDFDENNMTVKACVLCCFCTLLFTLLLYQGNL